MENDSNISPISPHENIEQISGKGEKGLVQKKVSRCIRGEVISTKMNKTIVIKLVRKVKHQLYKKYSCRTSKIYAHDPDHLSQVGDRVEVSPTRPLSKLKRWIFVKICSKA